MKKHKKLTAAVVAVVAVLLLLHFVPFDNRTGFLDYGNSVCVGYLKPVEYQYRWITGGVNNWDDQLSHLKEAKLTPPYNNGTCEQPAHIRLYLL